MHTAKELKEEWEPLNIEPVWNVAYKYQYNEAIEKYWGQLKAYFRPLLLQKMLAFPAPRSKDTPLKDALIETIIRVPTSSIPKFVARGLSNLATDADELREEFKHEIELADKVV